ncbi:MAG: hypothetical protein R2827_13000, partial [Bdellovibrionales bacterium]
GNRPSILTQPYLVPYILCADPELKEEASQVFLEEEKKGKVTLRRTGWRVAGEEGNDFAAIVIPEEMEKLEGKEVIFNYFGIRRGDFQEDSIQYGEGSPIEINMSFFEFFYLIDNIFYVDEKEIVDVSLTDFGIDSEFLLEMYPKKDDILSKFHPGGIRDFLKNMFEKTYNKSTDDIIEMVVNKNYDALKKFATARNCNRITYNKDLNVAEGISAYGFSPLMVAALLDDEQAVEILLGVEGIDPNFESPIFRSTYTGITRVRRSTLRHMQSFGTGRGSRGSGGSSAASSRTARQYNNYEGYTALMIAVAEQNCEVVEDILQMEPETINFKTDRGISALEVSTRNGKNLCLDKLLNAGAFDVEIFKDPRVYPLVNIDITQFPNSKTDASVAVDWVDFVKNVDDRVFADAEIKDEVIEFLVTGRRLPELKNELIKRVPLNAENVKKHIGRGAVQFTVKNTSGVGPFKEDIGFDNIGFGVDLDVLNNAGIDLINEKLFGENNDQTLVNFVVSQVNRFKDTDRIATMLVYFFAEISVRNPDALVKWINAPDSYKGGNPLVMASMFNEVGIVKALLTIDGIDLNVKSVGSDYTAAQWQYLIHPTSRHVPYSVLRMAGRPAILVDLLERGAQMSDEFSQLFGTPYSTDQEAMLEILTKTEYPFALESDTTKTQ